MHCIFLPQRLVYGWAQKVIETMKCNETFARMTGRHFNVDVRGCEPGTTTASSVSRGHGLPKNSPVHVGMKLRDGKWEPGLMMCGSPRIEVTLKQVRTIFF